MLEILAQRPEISLPSWFNFSTQRVSCVHRSSFVNIICTQPEPFFLMLIEQNKNHEIMLPKGRIGFLSPDITDKEEPKYQISNPYEVINATKTTDYKHNDCFQLHSKLAVQSTNNSRYRGLNIATNTTFWTLHLS